MVIDFPKNSINIHKFEKFDLCINFFILDKLRLFKVYGNKDFISNATKCYKNVTKTLYLCYIR